MTRNKLPRFEAGRRLCHYYLNNMTWFCKGKETVFGPGSCPARCDHRSHHSFAKYLTLLQAHTRMGYDANVLKTTRTSFSWSSCQQEYYERLGYWVALKAKYLMKTFFHNTIVYWKQKYLSVYLFVVFTLSVQNRCRGNWYRIKKERFK